MTDGGYGYYSIYLSKGKKKFVEEHLNSFAEWVNEKLEEEIEQYPEYCKKQIEHYSKHVQYWQAQLKQAKQEEDKRQKAYNKLAKDYLERDKKNRKGFLKGATGKKQLRLAGMTSEEFVKHIRRMKNDK